MRNLLLVLLAFAATTSSPYAQKTPFDLYLEPVNIPGAGGLQSYAYGRHGNDWLIIGGRLDGLHQRQPFATFDIAGHNLSMQVINPVSGQVWSTSIENLPDALKEQLSSTNMAFVQSGDYLYLAGGYGYSATVGDHTTYDKLTAVNVPGLIAAIQNGLPVSAHFRQISDPAFQVTGGRMLKIYNTYYLVGGQKFIGKYNPMGPNHGPGFIQEYTDQVRRFRISDNGVNLSVLHLPSWTDTEQLHRRDYNVAPQIMPNGQEGLSAFSGVFQQTVDLPFLNAVNIDSSGYAPQSGFNQYYNHYHCAYLPLYSAQENAMHTVFFGGMAQFFDNGGVLVQDNNVPFVRTIARVTRQADGSMAEYKLPVEMPALLGSSAELIPAEGLPMYPNEVIKLDELSSDTTLVGYIYGGIESSGTNIFWVNTGTESEASSRIFKVYVVKNNTNSIHSLNPQSIGSLRMQVFPNPNNGVFGVKYQNTGSNSLWLTISDAKGKVLDREALKPVLPGENTVLKSLGKIPVGAVYFVTLESDTERTTLKTVVQD